jgi:bifunctional DNA-binding transcriptional regulator/antitoxin component of YhaV-PrlF toxin-antitoxin module
MPEVIVMSNAVDTAKMSDRGQVIIPKNVREQIGARTDTLFAVGTIGNDTIIMKKINTIKILDDFRKIRARSGKLSDKEIEAEIHASRSN